MRGSLATLLALSTLSTACGDDSPFASFETRCGKLPPTHLKVVAVPLTLERDDSQSIETLTAKRGSALATHRANGLTAAAFGYSADIELNAVDDRRGSRTCGMPRLRVELSMQPVTVFVASELATGSCQHDVTLSHEMKHVEVLRQTLDRAARDLERDLPEAIGAELRHAKNREELEQRLVVSVRDYLPQFMDERQRLLNEAQADVDSPEEYARVSNACGH
jgi:hypothetical protein